jgi:hypothetical protein
MKSNHLSVKSDRLSVKSNHLSVKSKTAASSFFILVKSENRAPAPSGLPGFGQRPLQLAAPEPFSERAKDSALLRQ